LWIAEWEIAKAGSLDELESPVQKLAWVERNAMESGILPEQVDPETGSPVSVAPLTWSHATYVHTVICYLDKYRALMKGQKR
ncbi:hypothetical protein MXD81_24635, partial [Microbacteriaceae bacterium K1510]|nr:hypothetical protein [Microbacteriaceae bacterium K1510]